MEFLEILRLFEFEELITMVRRSGGDATPPSVMVFLPSRDVIHVTNTNRLFIITTKDCIIIAFFTIADVFPDLWVTWQTNPSHFWWENESSLAASPSYHNYCQRFDITIILQGGIWTHSCHISIKCTYYYQHRRAVIIAGIPRGKKAAPRKARPALVG